VRLAARSAWHVAELRAEAGILSAVEGRLLAFWPTNSPINNLATLQVFVVYFPNEF